MRNGTASRWLLSLAILALVPVAWWLTRADWDAEILGVYSFARMLLNLFITAVAVAAVYLLLGRKPVRYKLPSVITAFVSTGTADYVAGGILAVTSWASPELAPYVALATVYLVTSTLTQMVSNNAAAIIVAPIALALGPSLGVDSRPFLFAVCFAASAEFMTPMGYQTNLMVYGAGGYRFLDYTRFGAPLNLLFWLLATLLIPVFWSF